MVAEVGLELGVWPWPRSLATPHRVPDEAAASRRLSPQMFAMKSSLEHMDALELDFRMRLAEVQRQYKEKQRELGKLQRRREAE